MRAEDPQSVSWLTLEIHPFWVANEKSPEDTEIQQTLLPDLCEVCWGRHGKAFMQPRRPTRVRFPGAPLGRRWGTGSNTREPRCVCNIKMNQALTATPLRAAGWACGGNETMVLLGPHRHLHDETLTTTGAPGMSVRQAVRKRKGEMGGKKSVREKETRQST